jgi:hypothetical protein
MNKAIYFNSFGISDSLLLFLSAGLGGCLIVHFIKKFTLFQRMPPGTDQNI